MYPKMKSTIKDAVVGQYILDCVEAAHAARVAAKELNTLADLIDFKKLVDEMAAPLKEYTKKRLCAVCEKDVIVDEAFQCERCGFYICDDHAVNFGTEPDDPIIICTECMQEKHERR